MTYARILEIVLSLVAIFIAIVLHEVAHGYVALRLGDPTAKQRGRLTLNPLAHIDPIGTILIPLFLVLVRSPVLFGRAKPVPVNPTYFRNPRRGMMYVALAGPCTNILLALSAAVLGRVFLAVIPSSVLFDTATVAGNASRALAYLLGISVVYNIILATINLIPIPPLDGSRVLSYFLPLEGRRILHIIEPYGFFILIGLIYFGVLNYVFGWIAPLWELLLGNEWILAMSVIG